MRQQICHVFNQTPLGEIELSDLAAAQSMIGQAREHFLRRGSLPMFQRIEALRKFKSLMQRDYEPLVQCSIAESGKPLRDTEVEMARAPGAV